LAERGRKSRKISGAPLRAEFLATGSELLGPRRHDSNSLWTAERLAGLGMVFSCKTVVGDSKRGIAKAVRESLARHPALLVLCGGLGPTEDDLTLEALALALKRPLRVSPTALHSMLKFLRKAPGRKGKPVRAENLPSFFIRQARILPGFESMPNALGTAPGLLGRAGGTTVAVLPGVPYEFKGMWERQMEPRLRRRFSPKAALRQRVLHVGEMRESDVVAAVKGIFPAYSAPGLRAGVTTYPGRTDIHLEAHGPGAARTLRNAEAKLQEALGKAVFGSDGDTLEGVLRNLCRRKKITVAAAESCTGGLLAERLTSEAGASDYFLGGVVAYSAAQKTRLLGVPAALVRRHGVVSEETARAMARGARKFFKSDAALAVTGYAGPGGGEGRPPGTVCLALDFKGALSSRLRRYLGDRSAVRERAASEAMHMLRRALLGLS
jgi:nicotinamide-nucleotide amidase